MLYYAPNLPRCSVDFWLCNFLAINNLSNYLCIVFFLLQEMEHEYFCTLSEKAREDCRIQLYETDDLREKSIKIISIWLASEKKLNAKTGI